MGFGTFRSLVQAWAEQDQEDHVLTVNGWSWVGTLQASDIPMDKFAKKLANNKKLKKLCLIKTKHTAKHAVLLAAALETNNVLESLELGELKILDEGVCALAAALRVNQSLTSLTLSMTGMGTTGVKELASALKTNQTLTHLSIGGHFEGLTDTGFKSLGGLLGSNQTSLTSLDVGNSHVGPSGIVALAKGLSTNTALTTLDLGGLRKIAFSSGKSLDR